MYSPVQILIKPLSKSLIHTYCKINPEQEWDDYTIQVEHKVFQKFEKYQNWPTYFVSTLTKEDIEVLPGNVILN